MEFNAYHMLFIVTVFLSLLYAACGNTRIVAGSKSLSLKMIPFSILCVVFILFSGLVGDISADHSSYIRIYKEIKRLPFSEFLTWDYKIVSFEKGYGLVTWLVGQVFPHEQYLFVVSAALSIIPIFMLAKKSSDPCFFILVFLAIGYYFAGFNVVRQVVAASLAIVLFKYIEKGEFVKFLIADLIVASFHISALFMIPFFFLLRQRLSVKSTVVWLIVFAAFSLGLYRIMGAVDGIFFDDKYVETDRVEVTKGFVDVVVPMMIVVFCGFLTSQHKPRPQKAGLSGSVSRDVVAWNAVLCWGMFWLITLRFAYFERITYFFLPMVIMAITDGINRYSREKGRAILKIGFLLAITAYYFMFGQYFEVYEFFFQ